MKGFLFAISTIVLWSLTAVIAALLKGKADFITIVTIMMTLAFCLFSFYILLKSDIFWSETKKLKTKDFFILLGIGIFLPLYFLTYYYSLQNLPTVEANIINYLWIMVMVFISSFIFKTIEKFSIKEWFFLFLGFIGCAIVIYDPSNNFQFDKRYIITFISVFCAGFYYSLILLSNRFYSTPIFTYFLSMILSVPLLWILFIFTNRAVTLPTDTWLFIIFVGIVVFGIGQIIWNIALKENSRLSVFAYATPVASTFFLWLFLNNEVRTMAWIGGMIILISNIFIKENKN